ncbi:TPA: hypothetical protein JG825_003498 [Vibrio parahaemolyticus]|uniref:hypothetical protein n=1 Tax=Vibrio harveyi group TaxID=717610 RepID=UPI0018F14306|nr:MULTISPECIES: hypothetical protein [Vibrio harveyi group]MCR9909709.1 hypothetical protein [Vibrio campbellii]UPR19040.1 hypothetical protein H9J99_26190 [Vibrio parahaemolyticus]HAV1520179.1 hypothetical protein [Vibrio parahaemolyticus]HAV1539145.1 hypothetical protein [Vibrio parahaemolyticus]
MEVMQLFIYSSSTPSRAPWFQLNGITPIWCGLYSQQITSEHKEGIIKFITSVAPLLGADQSNLFHPEFLSGEPNKLWINYSQVKKNAF